MNMLLYYAIISEKSSSH